MQKLFSCMFGSRLYGTQTPTSDVDWKHIVLPPLDDLLLCKKIENKVKKTNTEKNTRNSADDVDEEFIPIQVFARHFVEGQTYALELAFAIEGLHADQVVFDTRGETQLINSKWVAKVTFDEDRAFWGWKPTLFVEFVKELREKFLTSNIKAMMGYVVNQANLYSFKGERLNATRDLYDFLKAECYEGNPDLDENLATLGSAHNGDVNVRMGIAELCKKYSKYLRLDEYDIGGGRMRPCLVILEKTLPFTNTMRQTMLVLKTLMNKYGSRADQASANNVDWKATMHALRIVDEGLQLLEKKELSFPFRKDYVDRLLSIKRGEVSLDEVKEELSQKLDHLKVLEKTTDLPVGDQEFKKQFEAWLLQWMHKFYEV